MLDGATTNFTVRPVTVIGKFTIKEVVDAEGKQLAIYRLDAREVEVTTGAAHSPRAFRVALSSARPLGSLYGRPRLRLCGELPVRLEQIFRQSRICVKTTRCNSLRATFSSRPI